MLWIVNIGGCGYFLLIHRQEERQQQAEMADISPEALYIQPSQALYVNTEIPISVKEAVFLYMWRYARVSILCLTGYSVVAVYCWFLVSQVHISEI